MSTTFKGLVASLAFATSMISASGPASAQTLASLGLDQTPDQCTLRLARSALSLDLTLPENISGVTDLFCGCEVVSVQFLEYIRKHRHLEVLLDETSQQCGGFARVLTNVSTATIGDGGNNGGRDNGRLDDDNGSLGGGDNGGLGGGDNGSTGGGDNGSSGGGDNGSSGGGDNGSTGGGDNGSTGGGDNGSSGGGDNGSSGGGDNGSSGGGDHDHDWDNDHDHDWDNDRGNDRDHDHDWGRDHDRDKDHGRDRDHDHDRNC